MIRRQLIVPAVLRPTVWRVLAVFMGVAMSVAVGVSARTPAASTACDGVNVPAGVVVTPSPCVTFGERLAIATPQFSAFQLVSIAIAGEGGLASGADRTARVDPDGILRVPIDTRNFFGAEVGPGRYSFVAKDITGQHGSVRVMFQVLAPPVTPTVPQPTPRVTPTVRPGSQGSSSPPAVSGVTVSVRCASNPEVTTVTNGRSTSIAIISIGSLVQPGNGEPYRVGRMLQAGERMTFQTGSAASENVLTREFLYEDDSATEGVRVETTVGTVTRQCQ